MSIKEEAIKVVNKAGIVCLCGSTKFKKEFQAATSVFSKDGWVVLSVGQFSHSDNLKITKLEKEVFDELHLKKIRMSDLVFVLNVNNYIGESTQREIEYARSINKNIEFQFKAGG